MSNVKNVIALTQETVANSTTGDVNTDDNTLFVDKSANRVGIGTNTPSVTLESTGTIQARNLINIDANGSGSTRMEIGTGRTGDNYAYIDFIGDTTYSDYGFRIIRGNTGSNTYSKLDHRGTGDFELFTAHDSRILFKTNSTNRAVISANGNVGIGTTTPSDELTVSGNVTASFFKGNGSQLTNLSAGATGGGADQVFFLSDQNVTTDYSIPSGRNALSAGPLTVNTGVTVTIPSGSAWTIV